MALHIHVLDAEQHRAFLSENRIDPVTHQTLRPGDRIVLCAECECAWLKDTWESNGNRCIHITRFDSYGRGLECSCSDTLSEIPVITIRGERFRTARYFEIVDEFIQIVIGGGEGEYRNFTEALAAIRSNTLISVKPGTYFEQRLVIDKPLIIRSEETDALATLEISALGGIDIRSPDVIFEHINIRGANEGESLFHVISGSMELRNCRIPESGKQYCFYGESGSTIRLMEGCKIMSDYFGCYLDNASIEIKDTELASRHSASIFAVNASQIVVENSSIHSSNLPAITVSQGSRLEISQNSRVEAENDIDIKIAVDEHSHSHIVASDLPGVAPTITEDDIFRFEWQT